VGGNGGVCLSASMTNMNMRAGVTVLLVGLTACGGDIAQPIGHAGNPPSKGADGGNGLLEDGASSRPVDGAFDARKIDGGAADSQAIDGGRPALDSDTTDAPVIPACPQQPAPYHPCTQTCTWCNGIEFYWNCIDGTYREAKGPQAKCTSR